MDTTVDDEKVVNAEEALNVARTRHEQGDDAGALKMAEKSLRIRPTDAAQKLTDHIRKFGRASCRERV